MADVAAQVVAWHNRHPLARRIARTDVQGIGIVSAPFARPAQPHWNEVQPKRGLLALMFPKRVDRRPWAVFSEDALPDIGVRSLAKFALQRGWIERPGPVDLPERVLHVDDGLLATPRGRPASELPPERLDRFLVTAAIDLGPTRPRLLLGRGRRMPVLGRRLWSLPRIATLGGAVLATLVVGVAGLWLAATSRPADAPRIAAPAASAASASTAQPATPAASMTAASPGPGPRPAPAPVPGLATPTPTPSAASAVPPFPTPASAAAASTPPPPASAAAATAPPPPPAPMPPGPAPAAVPPPTILQRASAPLVPSLRPDLAASARAEAARHPGLPQRPPPTGSAPAATPGMPPAEAAPAPRDAASAALTPARFYALVSRPMRSEAEANALLKRLRAETQRIGHPTAVETGLQRTPEGWRVTWWPFTHPRQAENARAALAARRVELEMVEF